MDYSEKLKQLKKMTKKYPLLADYLNQLNAKKWASLEDTVKDFSRDQGSIKINGEALLNFLPIKEIQTPLSKYKSFEGQLENLLYDVAELRQKRSLTKLEPEETEKKQQNIQKLFKERDEITRSFADFSMGRAEDERHDIFLSFLMTSIVAKLGLKIDKDNDIPQGLIEKLKFFLNNANQNGYTQSSINAIIEKLVVDQYFISGVTTSSSIEIAKDKPIKHTIELEAGIMTEVKVDQGFVMEAVGKFHQKVVYEIDYNEKEQKPFLRVLSLENVTNVDEVAKILKMAPEKIKAEEKKVEKPHI